MKLRVTGCSHHQSSLAVREKLAFTPEQTERALRGLRQRFPDAEAVLLSTCNRVELYLATDQSQVCPSHHDVIHFLADFHGIPASVIFDDLYERTGEDAVRHLFMVASSMDSMVLGEAQILSQVKRAFHLARAGDATGPLIQLAFDAANRAAKRVQTETSVHRRRISIPSVAIAEFASRLFERFDDKRVLVIGAGEMGEETVQYLKCEGVRDITIVNRSPQRAADLARRLHGQVAAWAELEACLARTDMVVSTTGATQPVITPSMYQRVDRQRCQQPLFILDLAVPRDVEPVVGDFHNVYLYSIDDLQKVCEQNRKQREKEWPAAERIVEEETARFMTVLNHRATGPTIRRLKARAKQVRDEELERLCNKLGSLEERQQQEIERSFDRLVNKLLHPPLESLRNEAEKGTPHGLLEALRRLFQLSD